MRLVDRVNISGDITDLTGVHLTQCGDRLASAAARWAGQAGRQLVANTLSVQVNENTGAGCYA